jgi:hypothetical protein
MLTLKNNAFKIAHLKVARECEVITNEDFKAGVKDLLDLYLIVTIPTMFYWVVMMFANNFNCEVLATPM